MRPDTLPLDITKLKTIAVIGENAIRLQTHGGESSAIKAFYEITPLQGLVRPRGRTAEHHFLRGATARTPSAELCNKRAVAAAKPADVAIVLRRTWPRQGFESKGATART